MPRKSVDSDAASDANKDIMWFGLAVDTQSADLAGGPASVCDGRILVFGVFALAARATIAVDHAFLSITSETLQPPDIHRFSIYHFVLTFCLCCDELITRCL